MKLFDVRTTNSELARKGHALAIIIFGILVLTLLVGVVNLIDQEWGYFVGQLAVAAIFGALFWVNRRGYVTLVSIIFTTFVLLLPFVGFTLDQLLDNTIILSVPILLGSLLLWPWTGLVMWAVMVVGLLMIGMPVGIVMITSTALFSLALITMLFAGSLNRANREAEARAAALEHANNELGERSQEQRRLISEQQELVDRQKQLLAAVEELSVPIIDLSAGRLMLPIVGRLSDERIKSIKSAVLRAIHQRRARRFIFDFTGQQQLSEDHWQQIAKLISSVRLLGCTPVLTGINADLALMITLYSEDLEELEIATNLQSEFNRS